MFRANAPQLYIDVDRKQCMTMGVPLGDLFNTLQIYLGSLYVNDFNLFGRTWQVIVQADAPFRNQSGNGRPTEGPQQRRRHGAHGRRWPRSRTSTARCSSRRYNIYPAASINGVTAPGISSRQGIDLMAHWRDKELPAGMGYEWTEMAYLEVQAGNTAMVIFALAVVMVFLVLAAQYESWSLPLAVILVVPMCLLSAIIGVSAMPHAHAQVARRRRRPGGHQHLHPDRLRGAGGPGQQERDLDRGVRQAPARGRRVAARGGAGGLPAPPAADRHDLAGLHPRRRCPC